MSLASDDIKGIYENTAKDYDRWVIPCKRCQYMMLIQFLELQGSEKVLDIGCGPGELTREIAVRLNTGVATGIDLSENMIKLARKKTHKLGIKNAGYVVGDYSSIKTQEGFDVCVNSYFFHWLSDPVPFLRWAGRVLKKHGKLGMITPSPQWYQEVQDVYIRTMESCGFPPKELVGKRVYPIKDIQTYLEDGGFDVNTISEFSFHEKTSWESCMRRVNAKSDGAYFSALPKEVEEEVKERFTKELKKKLKGLVTTESGYIVVADRM